MHTLTYAARCHLTPFSLISLTPLPLSPLSHTSRSHLSLPAKLCPLTAHALLRSPVTCFCVLFARRRHFCKSAASSSSSSSSSSASSARPSIWLEARGCFINCLTSVNVSSVKWVWKCCVSFLACDVCGVEPLACSLPCFWRVSSVFLRVVVWVWLLLSVFAGMCLAVHFPKSCPFLLASH